jgi:hypothetical protein
MKLEARSKPQLHHLSAYPCYEARGEIRAPAAPPIRGNGDNPGLFIEPAGSVSLRAGSGRHSEFHFEIVHQALVDGSVLQRRRRQLLGRRQPACPYSGFKQQRLRERVLRGQVQGSRSLKPKRTAMFGKESISGILMDGRVLPACPTYNEWD